MRVTYTCEKCEEDYDTEEEAYDCENQELDEPSVDVGDIVFVKSGYGWFDGDKKWVSNPDVELRKKCPNDNGNCFEPCCTYRFYYVITAIDEDRHQLRYHIVTKAMNSKSGHRLTYTYHHEHIPLETIEDPPNLTVDDVIGEKAKYLL